MSVSSSEDVYKRQGYGLEFYQSQTILMTGITALLTMIPCIWFYQKDKSARIVRGDVYKRQFKGGDESKAEWLEQSESQRLETLA